jgi:hypothetical protein
MGEVLKVAGAVGREKEVYGRLGNTPMSILRSVQREANRECPNAKPGDAQLELAGRDGMSDSNSVDDTRREILQQLSPAKPNSGAAASGCQDVKTGPVNNYFTPLTNNATGPPTTRAANVADRERSITNNNITNKPTNTKRDDLRSGKRNLMASWCNKVHSQHHDDQISKWIDLVPLSTDCKTRPTSNDVLVASENYKCSQKQQK